MEHKSKFTTVASYEEIFNAGAQNSFSASYYSSYSREDGATTEFKRGVENDSLTTSAIGVYAVQNTDYLNISRSTVETASASVNGGNGTTAGETVVKESRTNIKNVVVVNNGNSGRTAKITVTIGGETQTSNSQTGGDYDNGYESETVESRVLEYKTSVNDVANSDGRTGATTIINIIDGDETSFTYSNLFENTAPQTYVENVRELSQTTYTKEFLINHLTTTIRSFESFLKNEIATILKDESSTTSNLIISAHETRKSMALVPSVFTYSFPSFFYGEGSNTESYALGKGLRVRRYTINTFIEDFHNPLERFMVYNYGGAHNLIPPVLKFNECFSTIAGRYEWTDEVQTIEGNSFSAETKYGDGGDEEVVIEILPERTLTYNNVVSVSSFDDKSFRIESISSSPLVIPAVTSKLQNNSNVAYGTGEMLTTINTSSMFFETFIIKSDPLNYKTSKIGLNKSVITTFLSKIFNKVTHYRDSETSSGGDEFSTSQGTSGSFESTVGDYYTRRYFNAVGQSGSARMSAYDYSANQSGLNISTLVTNKAGNVFYNNYYAIVPDFKAGVIGFSFEKFYQGFSSSKKNNSGLNPRLFTCLYKNKNQTKIMGLDCIPFVDYEVASVKSIKVSSSPLLFASTYYDSENEGYSTYPYTIDSFTTFTTTSTISVSYLPSYKSFSSIIDDKNLEIYYSITRRISGLTSEEIDTLSISLFNSCSNSVNFRRDSSILGGCLPESSQKWTFYYFGHLSATKIFNGSSSTLEFFNPNPEVDSQEFNHGEALVCQTLRIYRPNNGVHFSVF